MTQTRSEAKDKGVSPFVRSSRFKVSLLEIFVYLDFVQLAVEWRGHVTPNMSGSTVHTQNGNNSPESETNTSGLNHGEEVGAIFLI